MKLFRLARTQLLPISRDEAWRFFSDPRNLPLITPPSLGFRIESDLPDRMYPGMLISYRLTPFPPLAVRWLTEITHVVEPVLFVDEQRSGPYAFWHHQHHFRERDGEVEMRDVVHYALPFGPLGRVAAVPVARQLKRIFDFRRDVLEGRFGGGG